jgi:endonuclease/exonuclease/phosphatase family metal-dependent hydrolase
MEGITETVNPLITVTQKDTILKNQSFQLRISVLSWNIAGKLSSISSSKLVKLIKEYNNSWKGNPHIIVIGLQEVPYVNAKTYNHIASEIAECIEGHYEVLQDNGNHSFFSCSRSNYGIATFVFRSKQFPVTIINAVSKCIRFTETKGFCAVSLKTGHNETIHVVNAHMPFDTIATTEKFIYTMKETLVNNNMNIDTSDRYILLGDLNSRSVLTKDCYVRNVTTCKKRESDPDDILYCKIKSHLEGLTLMSSISKIEPSDKKLEKINSFDSSDVANNCSIGKRARLDDIKDNDIVKVLLESDSINNHMNTWFPMFKEHPITFLPTYKRNMKTGLFLLDSKGHGRLPGYADRILVKTPPELPAKLISYKPLNVTGSDHLPLVGEFELYITPPKTFLDTLPSGIIKLQPQLREKKESKMLSIITRSMMTRSQKTKKGGKPRYSRRKK